MTTASTPTSAPAPGTALPVLDKPRWTSTHILRWQAAQQNWDKIHFDQQFTRDVAGLPVPVINGALKQHLIVQFLQQALPGAWPLRVDYQFSGPDAVGHKLRVQGTAGNTLHTADGRTCVEVAVEIFNTDSSEVTTRGKALMLLPAPGEAVVRDALNVQPPEAWALPIAPLQADPAIDANINAKLGSVIDARTSHYPLDLSRLRLFADAVMGLPAHCFDAAAGAASPWGSVVAPPLFPLHGLEALPGSYPLSEDATALGREGVNEVGRDLAPLFGINPAGGMNAGNRVQVHSLARVGERICATCTLVGAKRRTGKRGGDMIFFETLNAYTESTGRPLVTERQTVVVRLV